MITIDSDNESSDDSSGEEAEVSQSMMAMQMNQFGNISDSDSDSDSGPRVVDSKIDRFHNTLKNLLENLQTNFDEFAFHKAWDCIKEISKHHKKNRQLLHGRFPRYEFRYYLKLMTLFIINLQEKSGKTDEAREFMKDVKRQPQADQKAFRTFQQKNS